MRDLTLYPFEVRALTEEDGGGYLISFPDFSECISDGETREDAIRVPTCRMQGFTNGL